MAHSERLGKTSRDAVDFIGKSWKKSVWLTSLALDKRGGAYELRLFPEHTVDLLRLPSRGRAIDPPRIMPVHDARVPVPRLTRDIGRIDAADQRGGGKHRPRTIGIALIRKRRPVHRAGPVQQPGPARVPRQHPAR
jgi:hypothetical protein